LVISLGDRRVYVYDQDQVKTSFPVAIGRGGWETPTGEFQVMQMIRDPRWEHPFTGVIVPAGGTNPLGSRWIGFWSDGTNTIGFHGTPNESSVGQAVSHGCVRMYNRDVQTLFEMVAVGTPVTVRP
jgi:lipoprotein-anchoring transpeptidase ErfK/SrfK